MAFNGMNVERAFALVNALDGPTRVSAATKFGFPPGRPGETTIVARGGLSTAPVAFAWLVHQVRATDDGAEMRSRFVVDDFAMLALPAHSVASAGGKAMTRPPLRAAAGRLLPRLGAREVSSFGPVMLQHCAREMNHLATFLPQLCDEFRDMPQPPGVLSARASGCGSTGPG